MKIYSGLTSAQVFARLRRARTNGSVVPLLRRIRKVFPFGPRFPLYNAEDVERWGVAIDWHDALVAFGLRNSRAPLISAADIEDLFQRACPRCGITAYREPPDLRGRWSLRVWCPQHGVVKVV